MRLLGLAPGGVCLAADITADAGGLLHRRFTLAPHAVEQSTSLLHFAVGSPRLAVSQHRCPVERGLSSAHQMTSRDHPVSLDDGHYKTKGRAIIV